MAVSANLACPWHEVGDPVVVLLGQGNLLRESGHFVCRSVAAEFGGLVSSPLTAQTALKTFPSFYIYEGASETGS